MTIGHKGLVMTLLTLGVILFSNPELSANQFGGPGSGGGFTTYESDNVGIAGGCFTQDLKWSISYAALKKDKNRYAFSYLCLFISTDLTIHQMCFPTGEDLQTGVVKHLVMKNGREIAFVYEVIAHKDESLIIGGEKINLKKGRVLLVKLPANAQDKPKVKQIDIELPDDIIEERDNDGFYIPLQFPAIVERMKIKSKEVREFLESIQGDGRFDKGE